jgi:hypothetical protein
MHAARTSDHGRIVTQGRGQVNIIAARRTFETLKVNAPNFSRYDELTNSMPLGPNHNAVATLSRSHFLRCQVNNRSGWIDFDRFL